MQENFLEHLRESSLKNKNEKREYDDHPENKDTTSKDLKDLYADIVRGQEITKAEEALNSIPSIEKPVNNEKPQSPVKTFVKKNTPSLSPKRAVLLAAVDPSDPDVFRNKVQSNNDVALLLRKMWFTKRADEDTYA